MIGTGERIRLAVVFGALALIAAAVMLRLGELQLLRAHGDPVTAGLRTRAVPAPRGRIVDRRGVELASDRPIYEVRIEVRDVPGLPDPKRVDSTSDDPDARTRFRDALVSDLLWALGRDRARFADPEARDRMRAALEERIDGDLGRAQQRGRAWIDVLVDRALDDADAITALRSLDCRARRDSSDGPQWRVYLHELLRYERIYAAPDAAAGVVGRVRPGRFELDGVEVDDRQPVDGLERLAILAPGRAGERAWLADGRSRPLWIDRSRAPDEPLTLHTTLDLDLQRRADLEIGRAADAVTAFYGHPPEWGGMVLVDVATGGIVAAASYAAGEDGKRTRVGAFAPTRRVFPPGSVVKPLHIAMGLERGTISVADRVSCRKGYLAGQDVVEPLPATRKITDSHDVQGLPIDAVPVRDVLVQSSNIGAVRLGLQLGSQGIEDYLQVYRFGQPVGLPLPAELSGRRPGHPIPELTRADQYVYTGPSVLFGYEIQATIVQVARAYLTFLAGRPRELRLIAGAEVGGEYIEAPAEPVGERFLSPATLDLVKDALVGVVEDEHGTGREVGHWLRKLRVDGAVELEIAGKTGTSQYKGRGRRWDGVVDQYDIRTSLFVGFTPVREPRYLVVNVLQKADAASFYGGKYAAPAAARLLVEALRREAMGPAASGDRSGSPRVAGGTEPGGSGIPVRR